MKRLLAAIVAGMFALAVTSPVIAQDKKKEQVHKGTPEQGTVQKKDQKAKKDQAKKKDASGQGKKTAKKGDTKKKEQAKK
jgi:hypothetical protein